MACQVISVKASVGVRASGPTYSYQSIHDRRIIPFVFQEQAVTRASMPGSHHKTWQETTCSFGVTFASKLWPARAPSDACSFSFKGRGIVENICKGGASLHATFCANRREMQPPQPSPAHFPRSSQNLARSDVFFHHHVCKNILARLCNKRHVPHSFFIPDLKTLAFNGRMLASICKCGASWRAK